jgi:AcrR family transcriptional regulator
MVTSLLVTIQYFAMEAKNSPRETATDGRRARSDRTRAAIAAAMLDCFMAGTLRPSAEEIATRAGVSRRAVFRHFDNMEALLEEVARLQIERVSSEPFPPVVEEGLLDQRIDAIAAHSAHRNEMVTPVRRAALLSEPFSSVIRERHAWLRKRVRAQIRQVFGEELDALPDSLKEDRVAQLRSLLSFSYWETLRRHEGLSREAAERVIADALRAVLSRGPSE